MIPGAYPCSSSQDLAVWDRVHNAQKADGIWETLELRGRSMGLEYRNCPSCGSTLTRPIREEVTHVR